MASLKLKKADLWREVALQLGWGPGADDGGEAWSDEQKLLLKSFVDSGYSRFLNTPPIKGIHPGGHDWSFLKPRMKLLVPAGSERMLLPEDFGGFISDLTILQDGGSALVVRVGNELMLRKERQKAPDRTGRPLLAVVQPRKDDRDRYDLELWPTPDVDYQLEGNYNLLPEALSDAWPFAYGGSAHRETLLESCLAVAEERWDRVVEGPHFSAFMRCMAASIRKDRELRPQYYGYDADNSDLLRRMWPDFPVITINGEVPSSTYS